MATALQIQSFEIGHPSPKPEPVWIEHTASPEAEARVLFEMMQKSGGSLGSFRELISVPLELEAALLLYARKYPEDSAGIEKILGFRKRVADEFENLLSKQTVSE